MISILAHFTSSCRRCRATHPLAGLTALTLLGSLHLAHAQSSTNAPPDRLSYQGYLADANGDPLAPLAPGNFTIVFRIWTAPNGGSRLWSEQQVVTVDKGNFSVVLGEGTPYLGEGRPSLSSVLASQSDASERYIGINVTVGGTATEILPRLRLLPTPYAFLSTSARQLTSATGGTVVTHANNRVEVTGHLQVNGIVSGNGSGLTQLNVPANAVTSGTFADARIPTSVARRSGGNTFTENQVLSNGRLGIGTAVPGFPLSFPDTLGDKISLYGQSGNHFGFGIAPSTLQIHANASNSDIAFGYGNSANMTETMRIKGSGNVGIGNPNPVKRLHIGSDTTPGSEGMIRLGSTSPGGVASRSWDVGVPQGGNSADGINYSFVIDDTFLPGTEFMVKWGTGNVGIGTTNPVAKLDVRGDIKMGDAGQFSAAAGEESLRVVRGKVWVELSGPPVPRISSGSGFTVTRLTTYNNNIGGNALAYRINFSTPFADPPAVTVTVTHDTGQSPPRYIGYHYVAKVEETTTTFAVVSFYNTNATGTHDSPFSFIAVGAR